MAKILVVGEKEHETNVRALLLSFCGHQCEVAYSLRDAVDSLRSDPTVDVVFMDSQDRDLTFARVHALKTLPENARPIVVLCQREKIELGDCTVLEIPCSIQQLTDAIQNAIMGIAIEPPAERGLRDDC